MIYSYSLYPPPSDHESSLKFFYFLFHWFLTVEGTWRYPSYSKAPTGVYPPFPPSQQNCCTDIALKFNATLERYHRIACKNAFPSPTQQNPSGDVIEPVAGYQRGQRPPPRQPHNKAVW